VLAQWGSRLLLVLAADGASEIPVDTSLDPPVLLFTVFLSVFSVALFGLVPALRASGIDLSATMRATAKSVTGSALGSRTQRIPVGKALITAQVALSLVLLMGAALLVRSLRSVENATTGLDRDHLLIVGVDVNARGLTGDRLHTAIRELVNRFQRVAGVTAVSFSSNGIFSGTDSETNVGIPGFVARQASDSLASFDDLGPGYVQATGARLLRGRDFLPTDAIGAPLVVVLNESFARFYFGDADPVGRIIRVGDSTQVQVVGVVGDIRDHALTGEQERRYYLPYLQETFGDPSHLRFVVRTSGDPSSAVTPIRRSILEYDAQLPIDGVDVLKTLMRASVREERLLARLATGFGVMALLLAAIGLYGVMTYAITRRTAEIGLRVALGATRRTVVGMILSDALRVVVAGTVIGVPLALLSVRLLEDQLHGIGATDPVAIGVALAVLASSGFLAALLPALRASRVPPLEALREE
jgi:predicted permease